MSNEIVTRQETNIQTVDDTLLKGYLKAFGLTVKLNDNEVSQFIEIAKAYQLNPFKREIYCIPYGKGEYRKLSIITGYESYIKRAEAGGKLSGWKVYTECEGNKMKAIIEIYRNDWTNPFTHEVHINEYHQNNKIWNEKPITMIKKVAIAQGFRLAFPESVGGMPYTSDELHDEMTEIKVIEPEIIKKKKEVKKDPEKPTKKKGNIEKFKKYLQDAKSKDEIKTIENLYPRQEWTKGEIEVIKFEIKVKLEELSNIKNEDIKETSFEDTLL